MDSHAELKAKVVLITDNYIKNYREEFTALQKQNKAYRTNLQNKWAEMKGSQIMVRELNRYPETLFALFKIGLTDGEFLELQEEKMQFWLGNKYPDFKVSEGKN